MTTLKKKKSGSSVSSIKWVGWWWVRKVLIKGFIYAVTQLDKSKQYYYRMVEKAIIWMIDSIGLKALEEKGGNIRCGTCLNFYNLQDKLKVEK